MWNKLVPYWRPLRVRIAGGVTLLIAAAGLELLLP